MKNLKLALFGMMALFATAAVAQEKQNNPGWQRTPEDQAKNTVERLDKQLKLSQNQKRLHLCIRARSV